MFRYISSFVLAMMMLTLVTNEASAVENNYNKLLRTKDNFLLENVQEKPEIIVFKRKGCTACQKEEKFLTTNEEIKNKFKIKLLDISEKENKQKWEAIVNKNKLSKVTPITLIDGDVLVGFSEAVFEKKIEDNKNNNKKYSLDFYLNESRVDENGEGYSCKVESASTCTLESGDKNIQNNAATKIQQDNSNMTLPFFGEIDTKKSSLFVMSSILGFIDGFNPCAMWVLLTFLIILSQIGDRRKMVYLAGLFILAEGIMYFLILNVWYQTWDFIQLDQWVTPMVGVIAIGGGGYFLYKYYKNKDGHLTCEVTSLEHQQKTVAKIKEVVSKPITIITTLAVLGIAFSVNIIEFACSVGIAQSFTKILELNDLSFILRQWYIFIYSLFYMADDFLIFGLAIFGYQKFTTVGAKYSHLSSLVGGILMIILGLLLILKPEWLG
jgi:cytochrome c biogenesis protein CcdA/glutaredoxin